MKCIESLSPIRIALAATYIAAALTIYFDLFYCSATK